MLSAGPVWTLWRLLDQALETNWGGNCGDAGGTAGGGSGGAPGAEEEEELSELLLLLLLLRSRGRLAICARTSADTAVAKVAANEAEA